jgi:hypothetical protein
MPALFDCGGRTVPTDYNRLVNHTLLAEVYRAARNYHGALADYANAMRTGSDIEDAAQWVIGTSVRYRIAIDELLADDDAESLGLVQTRGRLIRLRKVLVTASHRYNLAPPPRKLKEAQRDRAEAREGRSAGSQGV